MYIDLFIQLNTYSVLLFSYRIICCFANLIFNQLYIYKYYYVKYNYFYKILIIYSYDF